LQPELVTEFIAEYRGELNRLSAGREGAYAQQKAELTRVDKQIHAIIEAVRRHADCRQEDELISLEARRRNSSVRPGTARRRCRGCARSWPRSIAASRHLTETLNAADERAEAAEALRDLIDEIRLVPETAGFEIELAGDSPPFLALTTDSKKPAAAGGRLQQYAVSGKGFEPRPSGYEGAGG